jgi:Fur family zinc uptake transcriptional regulator
MPIERKDCVRSGEAPAPGRTPSGCGFERPNDLTVLSALLSANRPLSAYQIVAVLQTDRPRIAAPTVYRPLDRLTRLGLARRIETMKAWAAIAGRGSLLAICDACGTVWAIAAPGGLAGIAKRLNAEGFAGASLTLEVHGRCGACRKTGRT